MRRRHSPPAELESKRARPDEIRAWKPSDRNVRTCFHCHATYATAADATRCEQLHEAADDARRS